MFRNGLLAGKLLEAMARLKLSQNFRKVIHVERLYHLVNLTDCIRSLFESDIEAGGT